MTQCLHGNQRQSDMGLIGGCQCNGFRSYAQPDRLIHKSGEYCPGYRMIFGCLCRIILQYLIFSNVSRY